jgi:hypothetical protein
MQKTALAALGEALTVGLSACGGGSSTHAATGTTRVTVPHSAPPSTAALAEGAKDKRQRKRSGYLARYERERARCPFVRRLADDWPPRAIVGSSNGWYAIRRSTIRDGSAPIEQAGKQADRRRRSGDRGSWAWLVHLVQPGVVGAPAHEVASMMFMDMAAKGRRGLRLP